MGIGPHQLNTGPRLRIPVAADIVKKHSCGTQTTADVGVGDDDRRHSVVLAFLRAFDPVFGIGFQRKAKKGGQHRDP